MSAVQTGPGLLANKAAGLGKAKDGTNNRKTKAKVECILKATRVRVKTWWFCFMMEHWIVREFYTGFDMLC